MPNWPECTGFAFYLKGEHTDTSAHSNLALEAFDEPAKSSPSPIPDARKRPMNLHKVAVGFGNHVPMLTAHIPAATPPFVQSFPMGCGEEFEAKRQRLPRSLRSKSTVRRALEHLQMGPLMMAECVALFCRRAAEIASVGSARFWYSITLLLFLPCPLLPAIDPALPACCF